MEESEKKGSQNRKSDLCSSSALSLAPLKGRWDALGGSTGVLGGEKGAEKLISGESTLCLGRRDEPSPSGAGAARDCRWLLPVPAAGRGGLLGPGGSAARSAGSGGESSAGSGSLSGGDRPSRSS